MTVYATAEDYAEYLGLTYPGDWDEAEVARINAGLRNAQEDVDREIRFSVYDPTDETILDALARATSARFEFGETTGDDGSGEFGLYDSVAIGSVRLARSTDADSVRPSALAVALGPRAATILENAGFFTAVVRHS